MTCLAAIQSCAMPVVAYLIIQIQWACYSKSAVPPNEDWEEEALTFITIQACWVIIVLIVAGGEKAIFAVMGEKLTYNIRMSLIEEIMHKQISWFDREDRAPGILSNIISADIANLNGMTSEVLVVIFELVAVMILGASAGAYFCW